MFTTNNEAIATLTDLNAALVTLHPVAGAVAYPITAAAFAMAGNPTADEIDTAIANCTAAVYDYFEVGDGVDAIRTILEGIVADPENYAMHAYAGYQAYISTQYDIGAEAMNKLVEAAHDLGDSRHQSTNTNGVDYGDAYIHCSANQLYGFVDTGTHRGYPMVQAVANGTVNGGRHDFGRW